VFALVADAAVAAAAVAAATPIEIAAMLIRPRFQPHLRVAVVPDEGVFVLSGAKENLLRGQLYEFVVPHIDGRTADEICDLLADRVAPAKVYFTLAQLEKKGYLTEAVEVLPPGDAAWWSAQQVDPASAARRLATSRVAMHGTGVDTNSLAELLAASGVQVADEGELDVVVVDHYLRPELEAFNQQALSTGRPWLLAKPLGQQPWIGPLFRPGVSGCWTCLAERLRVNRAVEGYLIERQVLSGTALGERAFTAASLQTAWGLLAAAVTSWLARGESDYEAKIRTFDLMSWQTQTHTLTRLPYCRACVQPTNGEARRFVPVELKSRRKTFVRDGGHRVVTPQATIERFGHHVSPITGAVSVLERSSPSEDGAMHVYLSGHNLARRHHNIGQLRGDLRNMSAGKGTTDAQAKASGLCEGLERYSGVFRGDEPRRTARLANLGGSAIDPRSCMLYSEQQYRDRAVWNAKKSPYNFVPVPFDPDAEIEWSPLWSLSRQVARWLPTEFCYYDHPQPHDKRFCMACSNGCAAGNTLEEAVLQGFLELVERDSVALWWYNRVSRPGVDLASFEEPYLGELSDCLKRRQREMAVLDISSDLGIPVFASWTRRTDSAREEIVFGFGAHLDPRIALLRAVTEMNQMLSYLLQAPPDKVYSEQVTDEETVHWLKTATLENQPYLFPSPHEPARRMAEYRVAFSDDVADDIRHCQSVVERQGMEMLVLDQTRPEIGLPVVKVVVPGLRHFWARFAPGRLYDVPVRLGWRPQPLAEEDLNPIPMFL
jgi:bacteriocin biosynthesis cyclodehydratase domain-containing protein